MARELLSKPDGFITVTTNSGEEYIIECLKRTKTHANLDDSVMYWTLKLKDM